MQTKEKKRLAIVAIDKDVYAAKLKLDELREKRKEMAADYKGLVKEMGMLKEEMLKTPPAEVEAASVVHLSDIDADSESNISSLWPKGETDLMRVPDQADRAKYIQMLAVAFEKVMPTVPVQTVDLTDAQADGGEIAHAAQARLQAQAAEAIASTVFSIVEDMKPVFCKPRNRFAPNKFQDSSECGRMGQLELFFSLPRCFARGPGLLIWLLLFASSNQFLARYGGLVETDVKHPGWCGCGARHCWCG